MISAKTLEELAEKHRKHIYGLTFANLVREALEEAPGDDYDGYFTDLGNAEHEITLNRLEEMLSVMEEV